MEPEGIIKSNWNEIVDSFDDRNLSATSPWYLYLSFWEALCYPEILPCIKGYDVVTHTQSGTGKTATFDTSIMWQIELDLKAT